MFLSSLIFSVKMASKTDLRAYFKRKAAGLKDRLQKNK